MNDSFYAWMSGRKSLLKLLGLVALFLVVCATGLRMARAFALTHETASEVGSNPAGGMRDGAHDFDFNIGVWHTHIRRIPDPFSGARRFG